METCPLCCEDKPDTAMCLLSNCSHQKTCLECMKKWIVKAEAAGHKSHATCPFCRKEIGAEETQNILGRPFQPAQCAARIGLAESVVDDLTLQWLQEQTKPCPSCGARIEKEANTCNLMECLCGYRFCFDCGAQGAECFCTPDNHLFWDNVLNRQALRLAPPSADTDAETGLVDLAQHIQKRKQQEHQSRVHEKRMTRWTQLRREERQLDEATSSARWLFGTKTCRGSLQMLQQQNQQKWIQEKRRSNRLKRQWECQYIDTMAPTWLFLTPARTSMKVLKQMTVTREVQRQRQAERLDYEENEALTAVDAAIYSGAWLFLEKECGRLLGHLFQHMGNAEELYCFGQYCEDWGECMPGCRNCGCVPWEKDERENAINLRLLFLAAEQKIVEKAEMAKDWMD